MIMSKFRPPGGTFLLICEKIRVRFTPLLTLNYF